MAKSQSKLRGKAESRLRKRALGAGEYPTMAKTGKASPLSSRAGHGAGKKKRAGDVARSLTAAETFKPDGWPDTVVYLHDRCTPSPLLPTPLADIFCAPFPGSAPPSSACAGAAASSASSSIDVRRDLAIKKITTETPFRTHALLKNATHPALGQYGLFATRELPARTLVLPYLGVVHTEEETDPNSEYDAKVWVPSSSFASNAAGKGARAIGLGIDATHAGNLARFVNDFRGIAERANVTFEDWPQAHNQDSITGGDDDDERRRPRGLALYTGPAGVAAGAELVVSYGKAFWEARGVLPPSAR